MTTDDPRPTAHRDFRYLLAARTADMLGNAMAPVALAFAVLDLTGSTADLGIVVASRSVTNVALLLFGGVLADRLPRSTVLVWSNVASFLTQAVVAAMVLTGSASIASLAALSALNGAAAAVSLPAAAAMLPETVPEAARERANAVNRLAINVAMVGGASLGGILVAFVGPGWGLAVDAATFLLTAGLFARISTAPATARTATTPGTAPSDDDTHRTSVLTDLREGWTAFTSATWIWVVVAAFMVINASWVGSSAVLGPAVADRTIGRAGWGVVLAVQTCGFIAGGLAAMRRQPVHPLRTGMLAVMALAGIPLALGLRPVLVLLLPAAFVAGVAMETFSIAWDNALQTHVPRAQLARVYAYDMLGSFLAVPIGEVAVGPLAERFGLRPMLVTLAVLIATTSAAALASGQVRDLRRGVWPAAAPACPGPGALTGSSAQMISPDDRPG